MKKKRKSLKDFSTKERQEFLEKKLKIDLSYIKNFVFDEKKAKKANIENLIGKIEVPLGLAGPLKIKGDFAKGNYFLPLATTEGALVASINRGAKAITLSGGAKVKIIKEGTTRSPCFDCQSLENAILVSRFCQKQKKEIKKVAEKTDPYLKFKDLQVFLLGKILYLRLIFETFDAMGMNMATIAAKEVSKFLEKKFKFLKEISLSSNLCTDKKPSFLNLLFGRGKSVLAECTFKKKVLKEVLKVGTKEIFDVWLKKNILGSALAGSLGFNAHFANIISAIFLATGQDLGHIVEGSLGLTFGEIQKNGDFYFCIFLPCLMVGTVGGGTHLETQKTALKILRVAGGKKGKNAKKFGEIITGAVMAGEISLLASLAEKSLAESHLKLNRL